MASGWRASGATSGRSPRRCVERLRALTHADGSPMIRLYGPRDRYDCGGTVTFNVLDARGEAVPYELVEERARRAGVSVRGGCFCNPGASEMAFGFVADRTASASPRRNARGGAWSGLRGGCVRVGVRTRSAQSGRQLELRRANEIWRGWSRS